jgi:hypothetical protein
LPPQIKLARIGKKVCEMEGGDGKKEKDIGK